MSWRARDNAPILYARLLKPWFDLVGARVERAVVLLMNKACARWITVELY